MINKKIQVDFCVIGGGMSGICAAIAAARHGIKVALVHDRPVLGGNASSEIRMHICGAHGKNNRETGIIEEIELENYYRNPLANFSIWDSVLYEKVKFEDNITLLLNCTCNDLIMDDNKIKTIKAWQMTTETFYEIDAKLFADCSGDGILAPLSKAEFRIGREAKEEYNESIEPDKKDNYTMGMSCLIQARETNTYQPFISPKWAYTYKDDSDLPERSHDLLNQNFWWLELGGDKDSIHDTEKIRDELLKIVFGVWDHIKNQQDHGADNWRLEWIGFLPGKRESRRYIGDYVLTQNDILAEGRFEDIVAYGGWSMDDHFIQGFNYPHFPTVFHKAPSPYGIPYRCLYSKNIENLFFAGRNISATHAAMSSTRVMSTCSIMGQAVGTAASLAINNEIMPRDIYNDKIILRQLQNQLMDDDCYLPWKQNEVSELTKKAYINVSEGNGENLRNGYYREISQDNNCWEGNLETPIVYEFDEIQRIRQIKLVFDSDLSRNIKNMPYVYPLKDKYLNVPETLIKQYKIEYKDNNGKWKPLINEKNNYQRLIKINTDLKTNVIKFTPIKTWGYKSARIFSIEVK